MPEPSPKMTLARKRQIKKWKIDAAQSSMARLSMEQEDGEFSSDYLEIVRAELRERKARIRMIKRGLA